MKTFLHVGYPKCASSFIQDYYFIPENKFIDIVDNPENGGEWRDYLNCQLLTAQNSWFNSSHPAIPSVPNEPGWMLGLSAEEFLDTERAGGVDYDVALSRYKDIFPDSKVLIVIRNQPSLIYSYYQQHVRHGYTRKIDTFIKELIWNAQQSIWGRLCFDRIYQITTDIFSDVLLLPFELVAVDRDEFVSRLNQFLGMGGKINDPTVGHKHRADVHAPSGPKRTNPSPSSTTTETMRLLNLVFRHGFGKTYHSILPDHMVGHGRFHMNRLSWNEPSGNLTWSVKKWANRIGNRLPSSSTAREHFFIRHKELFEDNFAESNARLDKILKLNLGKYNYVGTDLAYSNREA